MKFHALSLICICLFALSSCKKQEQAAPVLSDCLETKIAEFKLETWAQSIIKITRPNDTLYWFVDSIADGGEVVLDENCATVCIADCECVGNIVFCDQSHLDFPRETIWEK